MLIHHPNSSEPMTMSHFIPSAPKLIESMPEIIKTPNPPGQAAEIQIDKSQETSPAKLPKPVFFLSNLNNSPEKIISQVESIQLKLLAETLEATRKELSNLRQELTVEKTESRNIMKTLYLKMDTVGKKIDKSNNINFESTKGQDPMAPKVLTRDIGVGTSEVTQEPVGKLWR